MNDKCDYKLCRHALVPTIATLILAPVGTFLHKSIHINLFSRRTLYVVS